MRGYDPNKGDSFAGVLVTTTHGLGLGTARPIPCTLYHDNGRVVELHRGVGEAESDTDLYGMLSILEQLRVCNALAGLLEWYSSCTAL